MEVQSFDSLRVALATTEDIRSWSFGEVKKPETINYRTLKPEKDGLFCEKIFGPTKDWECQCGKYKRVRFKGIVCERCGVEVTKSSVRRERMGHIELAAPVTHIWYFKGVPSRLGYLLDVAPKDLEKFIYFAAYRVMSIDKAEKADPMYKNEYLSRVRTLLEERLAEIKAVASEEIEALQAHGLALQPANKLWEAPLWVDKQFAKPLEKLVEQEAKNPELFFNKKGAVDDNEDVSPVVRDVAQEREIKKLLSEFKKKTDKIVREYARIERSSNLQKEQLAWRLYISAEVGKPLANDAIFDYFDYWYGDVVETAIGAEAVQRVLADFDLKGEADKLKTTIAESKGSKQTQAIKRLKVVNSFLASGTAPTSMVLDVLPVLPPEIRPMVQLDGGRFATSDLNDLYRRVINRNNRLKRFVDLGAVPKTILNNEKRMLQEAVDALFDNGRRGRAVTGTGNRPLKSLSDLLKGKQGRFRQNLLGKRVDYSGRSVIVVGPQLKLHQCGLPKLMALELFKPFVMKRLVDQGLAQNIKSAKRKVERTHPEVWDVLEEVIRERPVLLNRAPTLHRLGIQAFEPLLVEGKAIQLHPLVCTAFNADFDGDQMAVHLPLSVEAQAEARILMLASNNILKPSDGRPVAVPTQDMIIGLYHLTEQVDGAVGQFNQKTQEGVYGSIAEALLAFDLFDKTKNSGLDVHATIKIRLDGKVVETTLGRALFNAALPDESEALEKPGLSLPEELKYFEGRVGKKELEKLITHLVEWFPRHVVAQTLDRLKDLGFHWATRSGVTVAISDVNFDADGKFDKARAELIAKGEKEHTKIQEKFDLGGISENERVDALGELWNNYTKEIQTLLEGSLPKDNAIYKMVTSKARGNWIQIRSIMGMRGPVTKSSGEFAAMPVKGNYLLGLSANEYFVNATGARKGNADTAMKTAAAGYLTRRLVDVAQDVIIRIEDCETTRGIVKKTMVTDSDNNVIRDETGKFEWDDAGLELSILHRTLADDIVDRKKAVIAKAGETVTQRTIDAIKKAEVEDVKVRTVLTCQAEQGLCAKCYGVSLATGGDVELGEAVGIIAAQSIGEPGTQLTMRTFHTGGASDKTKKEVIKTRSGGKETRASRTINYDITQGLTGVTDLLEARIGMSQKEKVAVIAFWSGRVVVTEVKTKSGLKKYEVRVTPTSDAALAEAKEIAKNYTFSRTTSKTFKKLDPEQPIVVVDSLDELLVEDGVEVERGDYIKDGTPIPQEVLATKSVNDAAKEIINGVQAIYKSQEVALHDKHLEVIVRQMLSKVTIVDSGETEFMPGETVDRRTYQRKNIEARDAGKKTAKARDEVMGMTRASLAAESWLSAASFQETTRVLTQAALDRRQDKLEGLKENVIIGKLIPAGTGLAAYRGIDAVPTEEAKNERYPGHLWAATAGEQSVDYSDDAFAAADLAFTSLEDYSGEKAE